MINHKELLYQLIYGAISGFIFGCLAEIIVKVLIFLELNNLNSNSDTRTRLFLPEITDLKAPLLAMVFMAVAKLFVWSFFKTNQNSISAWQATGVSFVAFHFVFVLASDVIGYIFFQYDLNSSLSFMVGYWIIFLFVVLLYNFVFSILLKFVNKQMKIE